MRMILLQAYKLNLRIEREINTKTFIPWSTGTVFIVMYAKYIYTGGLRLREINRSNIYCEVK